MLKFSSVEGFDVVEFPLGSGSEKHTTVPLEDLREDDAVVIGIALGLGDTFIVVGEGVVVVVGGPVV